MLKKNKNTLRQSFFPPFPRILRQSDRGHFFLAIVFFVALGVAVSLAVLGIRIGEESGKLAVPKSFFELKTEMLVLGYPIARMLPEIFKENRRVATYLVAIAKKESNWGKFAPEKDGKPCFNYWGYRGPENATDSGYSCFVSRSEAVRTVGARLRELLEQGLDSPRELVVWKRGFLDRPLDASEEKWVSDVAYYAKKLSFPNR